MQHQTAILGCLSNGTPLLWAHKRDFQSTRPLCDEQRHGVAVVGISSAEAITPPSNHTGTRDRSWFEAFFRANYAALCTFAVRYVDSHHEAEEIVQDALLQLWLHRNEPADAAVRTYAFTIVRNRCFDLLKKRRVRRRVMEQDAEPEFVCRATPESDFREGETRQAIEDAIDELPDRRREIFLMSRRDNLTYQEIATILSISIKTVETQMGRSLRHLRTRLDHILPQS